LQFAAPDPPLDSLLIFARDLLRLWRHASIPGSLLRALIRAASSALPVSSVNQLKLLALAAVQTRPPLPRASPGLGRVADFGTTFQNRAGWLLVALTTHTPHLLSL
jgi:hypothetical protein